MARPPRQYTGSLSPGQASYVVERLISERRVSAVDIERYVHEMGREISTLEQRLQRLKDAAGSAVAGAAAGIAGAAATVAAIGRKRGRKPGRPGRPPGRPPGSGKKRRGRPPGRPSKAAAAAAAGAAAPAAAKGGAKRGRKRSAITPEQLASRQLQGRYLALVRQFPEARRAYYAKVAKEKGREGAIKEMQDAKK